MVSVDLTVSLKKELLCLLKKNLIFVRGSYSFGRINSIFIYIKKFLLYNCATEKWVFTEKWDWVFSPNDMGVNLTWNQRNNLTYRKPVENQK